MEIFNSLGETKEVAISRWLGMKLTFGARRISYYTDLAAVIQMAKSRGWPTSRLVREMSAGLTYDDARELARKVAPLLDITVSEFMRLRKNE